MLIESIGKGPAQLLADMAFTVNDLYSLGYISGEHQVDQKRIHFHSAAAESRQGLESGFKQYMYSCSLLVHYWNERYARTHGRLDNTAEISLATGGLELVHA